MSEYLVVRLSIDSSSATWMVIDSIGQPISKMTTGSLSDIGMQAENRRVILLAPGLKVVATQTKLPVKNRARLLQMLPYSLENMVADDVDQLQFALGPRNDSGEIAVAIVDRDTLDGWIQQCADAGLSPQFIYSETEGIPDIPGRLILVIDGNQTYGRTEELKYFVLESFSLLAILDLLKDSSSDDTNRHVLLYTDKEGYARYESKLPEIQARTSSIDVELLPDGPLSKFASTLVTHPGSNLLQGRYAPTSNWTGLIKPWRLAASLLLGLGLLMFITQSARFISLTNQNQSLTRTLEVDCQNSFQSTALSTCRVEMQRRLSPTTTATGSASGLDFLATLSTVADASNGDNRIEALTFRNDVMDLRIDASSVVSLDELARAVGSNNLYEANIQSANPANDRVEGRLQIVGRP